MIQNYTKYVFYTIVITTSISFGLFIRKSLVTWKNEAVKSSLEEVKAQQRDITIEQQNNVIKQSSAVFKKAQQILKESVKIEKEIASATTGLEKVKVKHNIIEEINCRIINFNDDSICIKH